MATGPEGISDNTLHVPTAEDFAANPNAGKVLQSQLMEVVKAQMNTEAYRDNESGVRGPIQQVASVLGGINYDQPFSDNDRQRLEVAISQLSGDVDIPEPATMPVVTDTESGSAPVDSELVPPPAPTMAPRRARVAPPRPMLGGVSGGGTDDPVSSETTEPLSPAVGAVPTGAGARPTPTPDRRIAGRATGPEGISTEKVSIDLGPLGVHEFFKDDGRLRDFVINKVKENLAKIKLRAELAGVASKAEDIDHIVGSMSAAGKKKGQQGMNNERVLVVAEQIRTIVGEIYEAPVAILTFKNKLNSLKDVHETLIGSEDLKTKNVGLNHVLSEHLERRMARFDTELKTLDKEGKITVSAEELDNLGGEFETIRAVNHLHLEMLSGRQPDPKTFQDIAAILERDTAETLDRFASNDVRQALTSSQDRFKTAISRLNNSFEEGIPNRNNWSLVVIEYQKFLRDTYAESGALFFGDSTDDMMDAKSLQAYLTDVKVEMADAYNKSPKWYRQPLQYAAFLGKRNVFEGRADELALKIQALEDFKANPEVKIGRIAKIRYGEEKATKAAVAKEIKKRQKAIQSDWRAALAARHTELCYLGIIDKKKVQTKAESTPESPEVLTELEGELNNAKSTVESTLLAMDYIDSHTEAEHIDDLRAVLTSSLSAINEIITSEADDKIKAERLETQMAEVEKVLVKLRGLVDKESLADDGPAGSVEEFKSFRFLVDDNLVSLEKYLPTGRFGVSKTVDRVANLGGKGSKLYFTLKDRFNQQATVYEQLLTATMADDERKTVLEKKWREMHLTLKEIYAYYKVDYDPDFLRESGVDSTSVVMPDTAAESINSADGEAGGGESISEVPPVPELFKKYMDYDYRRFIRLLDDESGPFVQKFNTNENLKNLGQAVYDLHLQLPHEVVGHDDQYQLSEENMQKLAIFIEKANELWSQLDPEYFVTRELDNAESAVFAAYRRHEELKRIQSDEAAEAEERLKEDEKNYRLNLNVLASILRGDWQGEKVGIAEGSAGSGSVGIQSVVELMGKVKRNGGEDLPPLELGEDQRIIPEENVEQLAALVETRVIEHAKKRLEIQKEVLLDNEKKNTLNRLLDKFNSGKNISSAVGSTVVGAVTGALIDRFTGGGNYAMTIGGGVLGGAGGVATAKAVEKIYSNWVAEEMVSVADKLKESLLKGQSIDPELDKLVVKLGRQERLRMYSPTIATIASIPAAVIGAALGKAAVEMVEKFNANGSGLAGNAINTPEAVPAVEAAPTVVETVVPSVESIDVEQLKGDFIKDLIEGTQFTEQSEQVTHLKDLLFGDGNVADKIDTLETLQSNGFIEETTFEQVKDFIESSQ